MSLSIQDARLLEGMQKTLAQVKGMPLHANAAAIRDLSATLLTDAHADFKKAMEAEDLEEVQAIEARLELSSQRDVLATSFSKLYFALHAGILDRKMNDDEDADTRELSQYLAKMSPSEFQKVGLDNALLVMDRARRFGDRFVPDALADRVLSVVDEVVEKTRFKRDALGKENAQAVSALAKLEHAREEAKTQFLAARDLMSAAMRVADEHDKLNQVFPALNGMLSPRKSAASDAAAKV
ncbi:MAG: hypothetical protein GY822_07320 [Deltaproteobacteria bacterium]|nr:hypothetical protein [Deltaproteobacteria bacterium]